eukprot:3634819-Lingulodinium_polyedra.AAC.1
MPVPEVPALIELSAAKSGRVSLRKPLKTPLAPRNNLNHRGLVTGSVSFFCFNSSSGLRYSGAN